MKQELSGFRIIYSWPALLQVSELASAGGAANWAAHACAAPSWRPGCWATRGTAVQVDVMALGRACWLAAADWRLLACRRWTWR